MKVGILGGGQLAQMMSLAAKKLDTDIRFFSPEVSACASSVAEQVRGDFSDVKRLKAFGEWADVITYESESIPVNAVRTLQENCKVYPPVEALAVASDRLKEKDLCRSLGIGTADYSSVSTLAEVEDAANSMRFPAILKTRFDGYDGKGQVVVTQKDDLNAAWLKLGKSQCILESFVDFDCELSIIAARSSNGDLQFYPLSKNIHSGGILRCSISATQSEFQQPAEKLMTLLMEKLSYVGVLVIELFQVGSELLVNEMAPRVHNSGHWTMAFPEGSQFENHLRAIMGRDLIAVDRDNSLYPLGLINIIGGNALNLYLQSAEERHPEGETSYIYGKEPKEGRKLGHINISAAGRSEDQFFEHIEEVLKLIGESDSVKGSLRI